ncbi:MAG TPA: EAL domain-containing protein [Gammaproteobacteria bacterium]|jgi:diguanylate cyclase (GGDEF)-like protein/PAS domain S-box-containing protein
MKALLYLAAAVLLTGLYGLCNYLGLYLKLHYDGLSPLWPAAGIGVMLLWQYGLRWWPVVVIGELLGAHYFGRSWEVSATDALAQIAESLTAVLILRWFAVDAQFSRTRDVLLFVFVAALPAALLGGIVGALGQNLGGLIPASALLLQSANWALGDAMGILVVAPFMAHWRRWPFAKGRTALEWALSLLLMLAAVYGISQLPPDVESSFYFLLLPLAVLVSARAGAAGASSAAMLMALCVLVFNLEDVQDPFLAAMRVAFVAASAFTGYLVAAAFAERAAADAALGEEQDRALTTLQALGEGVISTHSNGKVYFMNSVAEKLTGWRAADAVGRAIEDVFPLSLASGDTEEHTVRHALVNGAASEILTRRLLRDRAGVLRPVEGAITLARGRGGKVIGGVVVFRDVSEAEHLRERLVHEATHDSLTGLRNRAAFDKALRELTAGTDRKQRYALLYLDLDQFKLINDTRGHEMGDKLLIEVTKRLRALVHRPDVIARLGGDEFGVLVQDAHEKTVQLLAEELRRTVLDYRFKERELIFSVGVSIGVTFFQPGERAPDVLSRADIACYIAKAGGRNGIHVYRSDDRSMMQHHTDLARVSQLETAMDEGRFQLYGQRIMRLDDVGHGDPFYEVLLRLNENGKIVPPGAFLPTAARFGFAARIDHWVVDQSFRFLKGKPGTRLSINLDPRTLDNPDFYKQVGEHRARHGIRAQDVCFEVTENVALENLTRAVETMHKLSQDGYRFALDDFGSGVASFGYLQKLPVQYVKIDGQFVQNFTEDPVNPLVVRTLSELARMRNIQCIAECVENETTKNQLAKLGVDLGQGFFLHKPEPLPA